MAKREFEYVDDTIYQSDLGDAMVVAITSAISYRGRVYFDGVIYIPNHKYAHYVFVREACLMKYDGHGCIYEPSLVSWGGGDYFQTIEKLEEVKGLKLSGFKGWKEWNGIDD